MRSLFSAPSIDRYLAHDVLEKVSALTHVTGAAEQLTLHRERLPGGVNHWPVTRGSMGYRGRVMRRVTDAAAIPAVTNALQGVRMISGLLLMSPWGSNRTRSVANAACVATTGLLAPRHHWGGDGSDQVAWMSQTLSLAMRVSGRDPRVMDAALWLASMQAVMSYTASGWVKLAGDTWRRDEAFVGVMRTKVYGCEPVWRIVRRYPLANKVIGKTTLALECSYPLIFLAGGRLTKPYLAASGSMHLAIAATMGLGRFVTGFGSLYGAVAYTAAPRGPGSDRDDRIAGYSVASGAAVMAGLAVAAVLRRRRTVRPAAGSQALITRSGARLDARRRGRVGAPTLFVLESGLMAPQVLWDALVEQLAREGEVVTYDRAGYGPARPGAEARDLQVLVDDLEDLVEHTRQGRQVVLVGHSLGGYLAHRLARRAPELLSALVLLDSTHPAELTRSKSQNLGSERILASMQMGRISTLLGLGPLMTDPSWASQLSGRSRAEAVDLYRDARLWRTGREEWRAALEAFAQDVDRPSCDVPVLSVSARGSIRSDTPMHDMHRELAEDSPHGEHTVLEQADHLSLLTQHGSGVATRIEQFMRTLDGNLQEVAG